MMMYKPKSGRILGGEVCKTTGGGWGGTILFEVKSASAKLVNKTGRPAVCPLDVVIASKTDWLLCFKLMKHCFKIKQENLDKRSKGCNANYQKVITKEIYGSKPQLQMFSFSSFVTMKLWQN
jgi:hypothetical protein